MPNDPPAATSRIAVVLGARNLGGAIAAHLVAHGWRVAAVARREESLASAVTAGALGVRADAADPDGLRDAFARVAGELGPPTLIVNAVSAARPGDAGPFGGGPIADATLDGFRGWAAAVAEQGFVFLSEGARALRAGAAGGTLVQITGGSARRAMPGRGIWSAGSQAVRAMVHAAAQELRAEHIHVALLVVDATIDSPKTASMTGDLADDATADQTLIAEAVVYLASQGPRALSHELTLTPAGDRWVP